MVHALSIIGIGFKRSLNLEKGEVTLGKKVGRLF